MNRIIWLSFLLLSFAHLVDAQPMSGKWGGRQVIRFKTPKDSVDLLQVQAAIDELVSTKKFKQAKLDSLMEVQKTLYAKTYVVTIYYPRENYTLVEELNSLENFDEVYNVSIYRKDAIPSALFKCKNLITLELIECKLNELPKELNQLRELRTIFLYNNITKGHLRLYKNTSVKTIEIRTQDPKSLPKSFKGFEALELLDLAENGLQEFPNSSRKNRNLKELNLQRNELTLKRNIKRHPFLERLALHGNKVEKVPASIRKFTNLKKLNFNNNQIKEVHNNIGKLSKLEQVSFYNNKLQYIPSGLYELRALQEIDLFFNEISVVGPAFVNWQKLTTLYLSNNKLTALPENIDTLKNLTGIYVWDNRIGQLPESIGNMSQLKYLRINRNYLKTIPMAFYPLREIEEIDFSHNYIQSIPESLFDFPKLKIIAIMNNPWTTETSQMIKRKAEELRKRDVFVHITED